MIEIEVKAAVFISYVELSNVSSRCFESFEAARKVYDSLYKSKFFACFLIKILDYYESDTGYLKPEGLSNLRYEVIAKK